MRIFLIDLSPTIEHQSVVMKVFIFADSYRVFDVMIGKKVDLGLGLVSVFSSPFGLSSQDTITNIRQRIRNVEEEGI